MMKIKRAISLLVATLMTLQVSGTVYADSATDGDAGVQPIVIDEQADSTAGPSVVDPESYQQVSDSELTTTEESESLSEIETVYSGDSAEEQEESNAYYTSPDDGETENDLSDNGSENSTNDDASQEGEGSGEGTDNDAAGSDDPSQNNTVDDSGETPVGNAVTIVEQGTCGDSLAWTLDSTGLLTISGAGKMTSCPWSDSLIKEVIIEEGVTSICYEAFEYCENLEKITWPKTIGSVGYDSFYNCNNLKDVYFNGTLQEWNDQYSFSSYPDIHCINQDGTDLVIKEGGKLGDNITWYIDLEGTLFLSGEGTMGPDTDWVDSSYWPWSKSRIQQIIIGEGITNVGYNAFRDCTNLEKITLPKTIGSVGYDSFYNCNNLKDVYFNGTLQEWNDQYSFSSYPDIHCINQDGTDLVIKEGGKLGSNITWYIDLEGTLFLNGEGAMGPDTDWVDSSYWPWSKSRIQQIIIGEGITNVGYNAFRDCTNLEKITLPKTIGSVGSSAFYNCGNLKDVYFNGTLQEWNDKYSFDSNPDIHCLNKDGTDFVIKEGGKLGSNITWYIDTAGTLSLSGKGEMNPDNRWVYSDYWPWNSNLIKKVNIGQGITDVGRYAFSGSPNLTKVTIPNTVREIEEDAFYNCANLRSVSIPNSVRTIGEYAFSGTGLTSISIPASVREIGSYAFGNCANLTSIKVTGSTTSIDGFEDCTKLTSVTIPEGVTHVYGFSGCTSLVTVKLPKTVKSVGGFSGCTSLKNINIPAGCTNIGNFSGCTSLESILIPEGEYGGGMSFEGCTKLKSIKLPASIRCIEESAFKDCKSLTTITIPERVYNIGKEAFAGCTSLKTLNIREYSGDDTQELEDSAFENCKSLTTVSIPITVNDIGYYAFNGCNKISLVKYAGTAAMWKKINIGEWNDSLKKAKREYNDFTKTKPQVGVSANKYGDYIEWRNNKRIYIPGKIYNRISWGYDTKTSRFRIYRKAPGETSWKKLKDVVGDSSYEDKSVKWGKKYSYTVRQLSKDGKSFISGYDTVGKTVVAYIDTPEMAYAKTVSGGVSVKWAKVYDAEKYAVFRKVGNGSWKRIATTTKLTYKDKAVKNGVQYTYTVRCISKNGKTFHSAFDKKGKTLVYMPATKLTSVSTTKGKITAKWPRNTACTGYQIQYSTSKTFSSGNTAALVAGVSKTAYTQSGMTSGKTYYVRIRKYKTIAGKKYYSPYSDAKKIKVK